MRIAVIGEGSCATSLRGLLTKAGFVISATFAQYEIHVQEADVAQTVVDGIDCDLERAIVAHIAQLSPSGRILLQRGGGVQSDRAVHLTAPRDVAEQHAIEVGTMRGMMTVQQRGKRAWWPFAVLLGSLTLASPALAQVQIPATGGGSGGGTQHVICDSGCGSPPATPDTANFVAGSTNVSLIAAPFDDGLTALASGKSGAPRMTAYRALHFNLRTASGTEIPFPAALGQTTMANSTPVVFASNQSALGVTHANFANLDAGLSTLLTSSAFQARVNTLGQKTSAASTPVVLASDQPSIPVAATLSAETTKVIGTVNQGTSPWTVNLITGFALAATQTDRTQKTQFTDGTRDGTVKAASTLPLLTDTAVVTTQRDPLPAGTNLLGKVGIDQTTPGTTNRVDVGTFPANQPFNIAQYGGSATTLGQKTAANSLPVVPPSDWLPPPDRVTAGDITTTSPTQQFVFTYGSGTTLITITGTWTGPLSFAGYDGTNAFFVKGVNVSTGAIETTTTVNGQWIVPSAGFVAMFVIGGPVASGTANIRLIAGLGSNAVSLAQSLPTGANIIGGILSNVAVGTTAPAMLNITGGKTVYETTPQYRPVPLTVGGDAVPVSVVTQSRGLPLQPCNALRRTICQPKGF